MKFLEDERLIEFTQELTDQIYGSRVLNGRIELFSCKRAGTDKKYAHNLAEKFSYEVENLDADLKKLRKLRTFSSDGSIEPSSEGALVDTYYSRSPLGDFHEMGTRKLMTDLILTLNLSFPDFDFSSVRPHHFVKLRTSSSAVNRVNEKLSELSTRKGPGFLSVLWKSLDDVIVLSDCEVFSYVPPDNCYDFFSTLTDGGVAQSSTDALWNFNYFFVNKSLKRIVFFTCVESYLTNINEDEDDGEVETFEMEL